MVEVEPFPGAPQAFLKVRGRIRIGARGKEEQRLYRGSHAPETLLERQLLAVVNLPVKRIAGFEGEVLVFGMPDDQGALVLLAPDREVPPGARIF